MTPGAGFDLRLAAGGWPTRLAVRQHAFERRAIRRLAVRGQHKLDRQVEQRTEPSDDIVAGDVCATAELDIQSFAEIRERVAGDDRAAGRQPRADELFRSQMWS
jgi:hypothetical protein